MPCIKTFNKKKNLCSQLATLKVWNTKKIKYATLVMNLKKVSDLFSWRKNKIFMSRMPITTFKKFKKIS